MRDLLDIMENSGAANDDDDLFTGEQMPHAMSSLIDFMRDTSPVKDQLRVDDCVTVNGRLGVIKSVSDRALAIDFKDGGNGIVPRRELGMSLEIANPKDWY